MLPSHESTDSARKIPKRRTQAARSEATRLAILEATVDALLEKGYAALRLSEVAERSGVSGGALTHHFGSKNELIIAATAHALERQLATELEIVRQAAHAADPISVLLESQSDFYLAAQFVVHTDLSAAARSEPALGLPIRELIDRHQKRRDEAWLDMLIARGYDEKQSALVLEMTFHIWRSLGVRYFRDPRRRAELEERSDDIVEIWRTMVQSLSRSTGKPTSGKNCSGPTTARHAARS